MKVIKLIYTASLIICSISIGNTQCIEDSHSPFSNQGWMSCNTSESIIPERGDKHWIMYDLVETYEIIDLQIWNHNVWGETGSGAKSLLIDYSIDNQNWKTIGPLDVQKAPGSWKYISDDIFEFNDIAARYILITVIDTWDDNANCAGFGEIKINVQNVVGADDVAINEIVDIFPNPASSNINIQFEDYSSIVELTIINSVGQKIEQLPPPSSPVEILNVEELHKGLYFISIKTKTGQSSKSFVKL